MPQKCSEKLKDPRWQKKSLKIFNRDKWCCQVCFDDTKTLYVYRKKHLRNVEPWDYPETLLITLCEDCFLDETTFIEARLSDLNEIIRENFLSADITTIAGGFAGIKMMAHSEVLASIIAWALSNQEAMGVIYDKYFEYLHNKQDQVG